MTLEVAIARSDAYALVSSDSAVFVGDDHVRSDRAERFKVRQLTNLVLFATSGCHKTGEEFRSFLASSVGPPDDLAACRDAAQQVIALMWDEEHERSLYYEHGGRKWRRSSLRERNSFGFVLCGFLTDGGAGLVAFNADGTVTVPELDVAPEGSFVFVASEPYGVPEGQVSQYGIIHPDDLDGAFALHNLFVRAYRAQSDLFEAMPDRTSADMDCIILVRLSPASAEVRPIRIGINDLTDEDAFARVYNALAEVDDAVANGATIIG